jgi:hypothetical protein
MSGKNRMGSSRNRLFVRFVFVGLGLGWGGVGWVGCSSIPLPSDAKIEKQVHRDLEQAVSLRGLPQRRPVAIERESLSELHASLVQDLEKDENRVYLAETELFLKQFRVLKADDDLKKVFLNVMDQQVAAYYDPEKKRVAYVEGVGGSATNVTQLPSVQRFVYVHEFCHAIEDGHFDLERLTRESQSSFDRNLALTSLVEGDAVLVGLDSLFAELPMNTATPAGGFVVDLLGHVDLEGAQAEMKGCPAFLGGALVRPYLDGAVFSNRIRREAGWRGVDEIYRSRLPMTTAEILYPDKRYLAAFTPAVFKPCEALFKSACQGVATNSLGALGTALWLGGDKMVNARRYPFLEGWLGDSVYLLKEEGGAVTTVWLTCLERPSQARALKRQIERRLRKGFEKTPWQVVRDGRLVAAVWTSSPSAAAGACEALAACALRTRVVADAPSAGRSWCADFPWPARIHAFDGYSSGYDVLGGYAADLRDGAGFFRFNLACGLVLRAEANADRHYVGTLGGLVRHVEDDRSDFTYWQVPLMASWFRRGSGDARQYQWNVLWGLLASGRENEVRVLRIPVWHPGGPSKTAAK